MHVCTIAKARATIGGPIFESRTPCSTALFQRTTTLTPRDGGTDGSRAARAHEGAISARPPPPAPRSSCRRENRWSNELPMRGAAARGSPLPALTDVEDRPVGINSGRGWLDRVVRLVRLHRRNALEDPRRCARSVTADRQDALGAVRERNRDDGGAVGPRALVDVVDEGAAGLGAGGLPADESGDRVGAACAAVGGGRPGAASGHRIRPAPTRGRDERAGAGERDRVTIRGSGGCVATGVDRPRGCPAGQADDVPANVLSPA